MRTTHPGRRIRRVCLCFGTPAWRPSCRAYSADLRRRPHDARHRVHLHPKVQAVRHFSSRHRTRLSIPVTPWPGAIRSADCFVAAPVPRGVTRPFSHRLATGANAVLTRGVRTTHRSYNRRATPTLGLGWSICSTNALRRRPNAAALLVSGGHPYSLAIPIYYGPFRPSPKRRSGVSRLVSGGLDMT